MYIMCTSCVVVMNPRHYWGTLCISLIYLNSVKKVASNKIYKIAQLSLGTGPDCPSVTSSLSFFVQHSQMLSTSWWVVKAHRTNLPTFPFFSFSFLLPSLLPFLLIKQVFIVYLLYTTMLHGGVTRTYISL